MLTSLDTQPDSSNNGTGLEIGNLNLSLFLRDRKAIIFPPHQTNLRNGDVIRHYFDLYRDGNSIEIFSSLSSCTSRSKEI